LRPKAIIGLSLGTFVASETARQNPSIRPAIVLISAPFKTSHRALVSAAFEKALATINGKEKVETILKRLIETRMMAYVMAKYINMYHFNRFLIDAYGMIGKKKMKKEAFIQMGLSAARYPLKKTLTHLKLTTLLIYGEKDKIISLPEVKSWLQETNSRINLAVLPKAGHIVPLERPKKVAQAIKKFLLEQEQKET